MHTSIHIYVCTYLKPWRFHNFIIYVTQLCNKISMMAHLLFAKSRIYTHRTIMDFKLFFSVKLNENQMFWWFIFFPDVHNDLSNEICFGTLLYKRINFLMNNIYFFIWNVFICLGMYAYTCWETHLVLLPQCLSFRNHTKKYFLCMKENALP